MHVIYRKIYTQAKDAGSSKINKNEIQDMENSNGSDKLMLSWRIPAVLMRQNVKSVKLLI